ncbi:MAG: sigma-70 family RNA polymerase sigma factor [Chloroflexi bacterium]|nr:MAG: sigma-70 family RNA polymerase sigma factor [Chloroflexota bacterium]
MRRLCDGGTFEPPGASYRVVVSTASMGEAGLIEAARGGDESAFDSLVGPLIDSAYKLAVVFLRDPNEAQDAVQEATVRAWRSLGRLRDEAAVRQWFFAIVANQCRSMRRARWWSVVRLESISRRQQDLDESHDQRLDLGRELSKLPATDRAVIFLFFYLDLPLNEVAKVLRISPQAAKSRVHRAVTRLRLGMVEVKS